METLLDPRRCVAGTVDGVFLKKSTSGSNPQERRKAQYSEELLTFRRR